MHTFTVFIRKTSYHSAEFETGLLLDTIQCGPGNVFVWVFYGDTAGLGGVLILMVASHTVDLVPAVGLERLYDLSGRVAFHFIISSRTV